MLRVVGSLSIMLSPGPLEIDQPVAGKVPINTFPCEMQTVGCDGVISYLGCHEETLVGPWWL